MYIHIVLLIWVKSWFNRELKIHREVKLKSYFYLDWSSKVVFISIDWSNTFLWKINFQPKTGTADFDEGRCRRRFSMKLMCFSVRKTYWKYTIHRISKKGKQQKLNILNGMCSLTWTLLRPFEKYVQLTMWHDYFFLLNGC